MTNPSILSKPLQHTPHEAIESPPHPKPTNSSAPPSPQAALQTMQKAATTYATASHLNNLAFQHLHNADALLPTDYPDHPDLLEPNELPTPTRALEISEAYRIASRFATNASGRFRMAKERFEAANMLFEEARGMIVAAVAGVELEEVEGVVEGMRMRGEPAGDHAGTTNERAREWHVLGVAWYAEAVVRGAEERGGGS
ncbi:hypothetical protein BU16DRAFT_563874 [Lophium mytilinum]|uniref:Uncharacterized protein n=1 Tax=Lophium mytilinum TaxID=390894 RepID=A0A6A6QJW5_9PEZI|nr:hypothetical protein BU16DRAFT_563874 [Lophium mytilinum]